MSRNVVGDGEGRSILVKARARDRLAAGTALGREPLKAAIRGLVVHEHEEERASGPDGGRRDAHPGTLEHPPGGGRPPGIVGWAVSKPKPSKQRGK
jgi:hypothetical protein